MKRLLVDSLVIKLVDRLEILHLCHTYINPRSELLILRTSGALTVKIFLFNCKPERIDHGDLILKTTTDNRK